MGDIELISLVFILIAILVPFLIYIGYCVHFYRIQSYFIYNPLMGLEVKSKNKSIEHEEITYQTTDGITIFAWYVPFIPKALHAGDRANTPEELKEPIPPGVPGNSGGVILFCHGNAGNVSQRIDSFEIFRELGFSTFIFDYRGYGKSEGKPSEKGTYRDAEGAWNYLVREKKVKPEEIIVFGRSLGGGIASYLAKKYQPRALIIESSFTAISDIARALVPTLPLKLLLRFKYNTRERLKDIHCPVLIVHSPDDRTIPFVCGKVLYETANPPKKFLRIKGDHLYGFIKSKKKYIKGLREFFDELPEPFLTAEVVEDIPNPPPDF
jgi:pimeloyl-ACP methyl ester carboxylesterase